jgi:hypothetical protein
MHLALKAWGTEVESCQPIRRSTVTNPLFEIRCTLLDHPRFQKVP